MSSSMPPRRALHQVMDTTVPSSRSKLGFLGFFSWSTKDWADRNCRVVTDVVNLSIVHGLGEGTKTGKKQIDNLTRTNGLDLNGRDEDRGRPELGLKDIIRDGSQIIDAEVFLRSSWSIAPSTCPESSTLFLATHRCPWRDINISTV